MEGLRDQSRAPHRHPNALTEASQERILKVRAEHPYWGARKIRAFLKRQEGADVIPAVSSIGKSAQDQRTDDSAEEAAPGAAAEPAAAGPRDGSQPGVVRGFQGWFRSGNGDRIDPLTISDAYSRYLLRCQAVRAADLAHSQPIFEAAFREYGLPDRMRTDNGAPFGSNGESGLTGLSVWWIKLGIVPERIEPGKPQQNGRHERMHRTLKQATACPPARNRGAQQRRFEPVPMGVQLEEQRPTKRWGKPRLPPATYRRRDRIRAAWPESSTRKAGRCGGFPRVDRYAGEPSTYSWPTPCREK